MQDVRANVTLCMIVKDEAPVIERCLSSLKHHLTGWCIVDTGSTDGTQEIIRRALEGIPGKLHERPWKNFAHNRTEALELARNFCRMQGWLLLIDADEELIANELPLTSGDDCLRGSFQYSTGGAVWARPVLARAARPWIYRGVVHELLMCNSRHTTVDVPAVRVVSHLDGHRTASTSAYEKYMKDAVLLERALFDKEDADLHPRYQFYLAQSYDSAGSAALAYAAYMKRTEMAGWEEEVFVAMHRAARLSERLGHPWGQSLEAYLRAFNRRPSRAEPLFDVAKHYGFAGTRQWHLAEMFAGLAARTPRSTDAFVVEHDVYDWRAMDEWATALTWIGTPESLGKAVCCYQGLLAGTALPPADRARITENLEVQRKRI